MIWPFNRAATPRALLPAQITDAMVDAALVSLIARGAVLGAGRAVTISQDREHWRRDVQRILIAALDAAPPARTRGS